MTVHLLPTPSPPPPRQQRPPRRVGLDRLARVEVQSIFEFLDIGSLFRLARTNRTLYEDASQPNHAIGRQRMIRVRLNFDLATVPTHSSAGGGGGGGGGGGMSPGQLHPLVKSIRSSRLLASSNIGIQLHCTGPDALSPFALDSILHLPPRLTHIHLDLPDEPYPSGVWSPDWLKLCRSSAWSNCQHLTFAGPIRGLRTIFPVDGSSGPLIELRQLTHLDIRRIELYGNSLRCLPKLNQLRTLRLHDSDWSLQGLTSTSGSFTRMMILSHCDSLTNLDVSRPFLNGFNFEKVFGGPIRRSLKSLTIQGFQALGRAAGSGSASGRTNTNLQEPSSHIYGGTAGVVANGASVTGGGRVDAINYPSAFGSLECLTHLTLKDVTDTDHLLVHGVLHAPFLKSLRIETNHAMIPSLQALKTVLDGHRQHQESPESSSSSITATPSPPPSPRYPHVHLCVSSRSSSSSSSSSLSTPEGWSSRECRNELEQLKAATQQRFSFEWEEPERIVW